MVLDLGSFSRRGLLVNHVRPADTWGGKKHREGGECNTRNEAEEATNLLAIVK